MHVQYLGPLVKFTSMHVHQTKLLLYVHRISVRLMQLFSMIAAPQIAKSKACSNVVHPQFDCVFFFCFLSQDHMLSSFIEQKRIDTVYVCVCVQNPIVRRGRKFHFSVADHYASAKRFPKREIR